MHAIKAIEDAFQFGARDADALIANAERNRVDVGRADIDDDVFVPAGIFHGVIEQIENGGAQLFWISHDDQIGFGCRDPKRKHVRSRDDGATE